MTSADNIINEALGIVNPVEKAFAETAVTIPRKISQPSITEDDINNSNALIALFVCPLALAYVY